MRQSSRTTEFKMPHLHGPCGSECKQRGPGSMEWECSTATAICKPALLATRSTPAPTHPQSPSHSQQPGVPTPTLRPDGEPEPQIRHPGGAGTPASHGLHCPDSDPHPYEHLRILEYYRLWQLRVRSMLHVHLPGSAHVRARHYLPKMEISRLHYYRALGLLWTLLNLLRGLSSDEADLKKSQ